MKFNIISVMPGLIQDALQYGVVGSAFKKGLCQYAVINPRDFTSDVHQTVDDRPFGGGDGMLMLAEPLQQAIDSLATKSEVYYLSPQGKVFNDDQAKSLSGKQEITLVCGRYGGVDQRFLTVNNIKEISIGDYVLSGGELGALVIIDAVARKIPGVLGHESSASEDSFANGLLEVPFFTRPALWQDLEVPDVLRSGDHKRILEFKEKMGWIVTLLKRPELFKNKAVDWKACYKYIQSFKESELYFLGEKKDKILEKISEKINE